MAGQKTRRKYDVAYKQQVLQMLEDGQPASKIAQSLGIGESLIYSWKRQAKEALAGENANASLWEKKEEPAELQAENERLRRKVWELEEAQTILA
ncbi:MAG: transposase [Saprospiraceae bacterium]|nr:transposase [Saprospiraceae bacterium]